jgi:predicted dehydrogenase
MDLASIAKGLASPAERWGYAAEDRLFLDSIEQGKPPAVTAAEGVRAIRIALALYESIPAGAPVRL